MPATQAKGPLGVIAIWIVVGTIAALSCSLNFSAARLGGEYLPVGNDSFYHARRILDTVHDPANFYEFDSKIHAPEGSLLVWPWGYDYLMAQIVRAGLATGLSTDPMAILIWIPVAAVFISIGLLVIVARRLSLSHWAMTLAALCMALAPTTQLLHGMGEIDHHYAEMIFVLATLAAGLAWFRKPDPASAAALATTLGIAPAIHNGLFILQLPFLITLFICWVQGQTPPKQPITVFAVVLLCSTLAILVPSLPFRMGRFEFYTLSWFHLYIAFGSALTAILLSRLRRTRSGVAVLVAAGVAMFVPLIGQLNIAESFVTGTAKYLDAIAEMVSPFTQAITGHGKQISNFYSYLIWIAPLTTLVSLIQCWRDRNSPRLFFWVTCVCGLALLSAQTRMHYFGDFALYLPWLVLAEDYSGRRPELRKRVFLIASLALVLLYVPPLRHQLIAPMPRANDLAFEDIRPIFTTLHKACAEDPGIVLADGNAGHYIRYYTDCSVIANTFLLTPQHFDKTDEANRLHTLSAAELAVKAPLVKYVLIRPLAMNRRGEGKIDYTFFTSDARLDEELLLGPRQALPSHYVLLDEVRFREVENAPYATLYKIRR